MRKFSFWVLPLCLAFIAVDAHKTFSQSNSIFFDNVEVKSEAVKKANKKLAANDPAGALKILDEAIEKKKDLLENYRERSLLRRLYTKDVDGAVTDLDEVLKIKPDDVDSYVDRAHLKNDAKNDFRGALSDYETALKYQPASILLLKSVATAKANLKDFDGATATLEAALKIKPDSIDLHLMMSRFLALRAPAAAISYLQNFLDAYVQKNGGKLPHLKGEKINRSKKLDEHGGDPTPFDKTPVRRYSQREFTASSKEDLQKQQAAIEDLENLAKAYVALGKLYIEQNDYDKAVTSLDAATQVNNNEESAYGLRGIIYLFKGNYEKAIAELTDAINIADEPYFFLNRGIAYLKMSVTQKAEKDFDYFLKLYPDGKAMLNQRIAEAKK